MVMTLKDSQANIIVGLGSYTHTTTHAGPYTVSAQCSENPTSSIIITISQSGSSSVSVSSIAPTDSQSHIELQKQFTCAIGDVLTVALVSAAAIDNQLNNVKTIVRVFQGS